MKKFKIILDFFIAGALMMLFYLGLAEKYEAPIYISQEFTVDHYFEGGKQLYKIEGKVTNLTDETLEVNSFTIKCSAVGSDTVGVHSVSFTISPKETRNFYSDSLVLENGSFAILTEVSSVTCVIDGTKYTLDYSKDGKKFSNLSKEKTFYLIISITGTLFVVFSISMFVYWTVKEGSIKNWS